MIPGTARVATCPESLPSMPTLKLHYDGWIALPVRLRQALGLTSGDRLEAELVDGALVLRPVGKTRGSAPAPGRGSSRHRPSHGAVAARGRPDAGPARARAATQGHQRCGRGFRDAEEGPRPSPQDRACPGPSCGCRPAQCPWPAQAGEEGRSRGRSLASGPIPAGCSASPAAPSGAGSRNRRASPVPQCRDPTAGAWPWAPQATFGRNLAPARLAGMAACSRHLHPASWRPDPTGTPGQPRARIERTPPWAWLFPAKLPSTIHRRVRRGKRPGLFLGRKGDDRDGPAT